MRDRRDDVREDLGCGAVPNNRARRVAIVALAGLALGGCALSFPIKGIETDSAPTGSIDRTAALLSPTLDREDLRRAKAALAVTLDPQGNGARVGWQNPQSGAHGAFTAAGTPFADRDRVCRRFKGEVAPSGSGERSVAGSACREADGSWQVRAAGDVGA